MRWDKTRLVITVTPYEEFYVEYLGGTLWIYDGEPINNITSRPMIYSANAPRTRSRYALISRLRAATPLDHARIVATNARSPNELLVD